MEENRNNRKTYLIIAIVPCTVLVIALGIFLGYKLTKTKTPTEAPKETKDEEALSGEETPSFDEEAGAGEWVLVRSKQYWLDSDRECLHREDIYDEQGRPTESRYYNSDDGSVEYTRYHSYDHNGEWQERWIPDRGGKLEDVWFVDMTGNGVLFGGSGTYEEEFYDDGYIKEFRVYWEQSKKLQKIVKWEYDDGRKNIRRIFYRDWGDGELKLMDDLLCELDSDGRVVRCVNHGEWDGSDEFPAFDEYECRYEGNRRIETSTCGDGYCYDEVVYEGDREISWKTTYADGTGNVERYYPHINSFPPYSRLRHAYLESEFDIAADGTETFRYKVEFTNDGQPLRKIEVETGAVLEEYQYGADGKLCAVLTGDAKTPLQKTADIKLDQYGNLVEYINYGMGFHERYEWIRLPEGMGVQNGKESE